MTYRSLNFPNYSALSGITADPLFTYCRIGRKSKQKKFDCGLFAMLHPEKFFGSSIKAACNNKLFTMHYSQSNSPGRSFLFNTAIRLRVVGRHEGCPEFQEGQHLIIININMVVILRPLLISWLLTTQQFLQWLPI